MSGDDLYIGNISTISSLLNRAFYLENFFEKISTDRQINYAIFDTKRPFLYPQGKQNRKEYIHIAVSHILM